MSSPVNERTDRFRRNEDLETLLLELGTALAPCEQQLMPQRYAPTYPTILLLGPLRSGSTLFMQWLASLDLFAYPTNLLSRFYMAPILGAKIQLLLTNPRYRFRDELPELSLNLSYQSDNGKTSGTLSPNEFWYFWRRFLPDSQRDTWADQELLSDMDAESMRLEIQGMADAFARPMAFKGMLFNYNVAAINQILDKVIFVHLQRDYVDNCLSILEARKRQLGSENSWYSFKIPEYNELVKLPAIEQATGQAFYINRAVARGLSDLPANKKISIKYEDFCKDPRLVFEELTSKAGIENASYRGKTSFSIPRKNVDASVRRRIQGTIERLYRSCKD